MEEDRGPTRPDGRAGNALSSREVTLSVKDVSKSFGSTQAVRDVSVQVHAGEALGIVGHNGAGKTTLMKVLAGLTLADSGTISFGSRDMPSGFDVMDARAAGLRLASQEITLCPDLRVFENVVLAHPALARLGGRWRAATKARFASAMGEIFPGRVISPQAVVGRLSLSERQMVQLTVAMLPEGSPTRCVVLDEPTSALVGEVAEELFGYLRKLRTEAGVSVVIISHKMRDILENTDRVVVMKDGAVVKELSARGLNAEAVIDAMGGQSVVPLSSGADIGGASRIIANGDDPAAAAPVDDVVPLRPSPTGSPTTEQMVRVVGPAFSIRAGEVVGLSGLEGQGQAGALQAIWSASRHRWRARVPWGRWKAWQVVAGTRVAYVSGDRQEFGVFPLWNVKQNLSVAALRKVRRGGLLSQLSERRLTDRWMREMEIRASANQSIMELSGGNQQKVLLARGLASDPDVIILDDPFRGVDIMTRRSSYRWLRDEASKGTSIIWYSSEGEEMRECDRVYVFNGGEVVAELSEGNISEEQIIKHSFAEARENVR